MGTEVVVGLAGEWGRGRGFSTTTTLALGERVWGGKKDLTISVISRKANGRGKKYSGVEEGRERSGKMKTYGESIGENKLRNSKDRVVGVGNL